MTDTYILAAHIAPLGGLKYIAYLLPQDASVSLPNISIQEIKKLKLSTIHTVTLEELAKDIVKENPPEEKADSAAIYARFFGLPQAQFTSTNHGFVDAYQSVRPLDSKEYDQFSLAWQETMTRRGRGLSE